MMKTSIKKIAALLLALVVMIPVGVIGVSADSNTTEIPKIEPTKDWGPNANGDFEIATAGDLLAFAEKRSEYNNYSNKTVFLTADIDFNPNWDASTSVKPSNVWTPLEWFWGTFNGQGYTIKGLYSEGDSQGNNASFIVRGFRTTIKNLKIENARFTSKNCSGFVAAVRGVSNFADLYVDAYIEATDADGGAGGIVAWYYTTVNKNGSKNTPAASFTNCVFAGEVRAKAFAGGIVGSNKDTNGLGEGNYDAKFSSCANYGTIICDDTTKAAGIIGDASGFASLTRCYNGGTVGTALANVTRLTDAKDENNEDVVAVTLNESYYQANSGVTGMTVTGEANDVVVKYAGTVADALQTATSAELVQKTAYQAKDEFKGWVVDQTSSRALPLMVKEIVNGHSYTTSTTAPTCTDIGYTTYTCTNDGCGHTYVGKVLEPLGHTPSDEWVISSEATEERAGSKYQPCTVCNAATNTQVIPKLKSEDTEAVSDEVTTDASADGTEKEGGCGSSIALSSALAMTAMLAMGASTVCKKKK